jgi:hypothetical protein
MSIRTLSLFGYHLNALLKKLFSSVFIVLVLLNVMGYYGIFAGLQYSNTRDMIRQFDAGIYNKKEARTFKIPFSSAHSSEEFERVDGDFERDGEMYRLIKQRIYRDTFHIVYIKDKTATALKNVIEDYVKTFSEDTQDESHQTVLPIFIKEYFARPFFIQHRSPGYQQTIRKESRQAIFIDSYMRSIIHPPERA